MTQQAIMSTDGRDKFQRMGRREIWKALKKAHIPFPPGITSEDGIKLLQANQVDPMAVIEWQEVRVTDEKGNVQVQHHPKRREPKYDETAELRRDEEMQRRLDEATAKETAAQDKTRQLETQLKELTKQVSTLTEIVIQQVQKPAKKPTKPKVIETDPAKMKYMAFKKWCAERNYELKKGEDRTQVIAQLAKD